MSALFMTILNRDETSHVQYEFLVEPIPRRPSPSRAVSDYAIRQYISIDLYKCTLSSFPAVRRSAGEGGVMDVARMIGAVSRVVGSARGRTAGRRGWSWRDAAMPARSHDVWDALTNPERIPRWFLPVSGDLRLGGRYQLKGNAGGTITRCEPPRRARRDLGIRRVGELAHGHAAPRPARPPTLELEHVAHVDDALWDQFGPGAVGVGWDLGLMGLAEHLGGAPAVDPATRRGVGRRPTRARPSSAPPAQSWADAAIAAGTPEAAARAAAARTTAFYTGALTSSLMHAFDVLRDPVRRRILELLAAGERAVGPRRRGDPARVRHHPAGGVAAPEGAARQRLRLGASRRRPAALRGGGDGAATSSTSWLGRFRADVGAAARGAGHRGGARQAAGRRR